MSVSLRLTSVRRVLMLLSFLLPVTAPSNSGPLMECVSEHLARYLGLSTLNGLRNVIK